jgi:hypothetical protein
MYLKNNKIKYVTQACHYPLELINVCMRFCVYLRMSF